MRTTNSRSVVHLGPVEQMQTADYGPPVERIQDPNALIDAATVVVGKGLDGFGPAGIREGSRADVCDKPRLGAGERVDRLIRGEARKTFAVGFVTGLGDSSGSRSRLASRPLPGRPSRGEQQLHRPRRKRRQLTRRGQHRSSARAGGHRFSSGTHLDLTRRPPRVADVAYGRLVTWRSFRNRCSDTMNRRIHAARSGGSAGRPPVRGGRCDG
jgi:hypothetical protein